MDYFNLNMTDNSDNFSLQILPVYFENYTSIANNDLDEISQMLHIILTKVLRPPVMIFGIVGNLLNILILSRHKSRRTRSAITFLIAMSAMDLVQLTVQLIFVILEWIKAFSFVTATISTYYRCYVKYVLFWNIKFYERKNYK